MNIVKAVSDNRKAVLLIIFILIAAGVYAAFRLPSGIYPEVNFPRIVIVADAGDLPTGNMLLGVTRPIEESVSGVLGIYRVRSKTIRGESEISLQFLPHTDMLVALQQVQAKVSEVRTALPAETELTVERLTPAVFPVLSYILTGRNVGAADLRDYALYSVRPTLSRISGVGQVNILGDTVREIEVIVQPEKLLANHLTLDDVETAIRKANAIQAVGRLNKDYKQFMLLISSEIPDIEALQKIVVSGGGGNGGSGAQADEKGATAPPEKPSGAVVYLGDVADVRAGTQDKLMLISGDGEPAAQINVTRQIGGNILDIEKEARKSIVGLTRTLPSNVRFTTVYDLAEFVRDSIGSVRDAILIGILLSIAVLLFFLRDWRSTLIAASSIPVTLVITLFFIYKLGETLNVMSLGGMAVAIGLVIDDAIVVIENIHRHLEASDQTDEGRKTAVSAATQEIWGAVAGSTFTTVVVFLPLGLVEGVVGQFFAAFSITLSVAVLVSLVLAFVLIPLMAGSLLRPRGNGPRGDFLEPLKSRYDRVVHGALRHTTAVLLGTILFVGGGVLVYFQLGSGFLPTMDEGSFVLDYWLPSGTSLVEGDRVIRSIEQTLKQTPEVESFSRRTGAEMGLFATEQSRGDILVRLKKQRHRDVEEIMDDVRDKVESSLPSVRVEFVQVLQDLLGDLEGSPEPVEVKLFGDDLKVLQEKAKAIAEQVGKLPGIVDLFSGVQQGNPEILVELDSTKVNKAGLDPETVTKQLSGALLGEVVTQVRQFDRLIGVRVRFPDRVRYNYEFIRQFPLQNDKTGAVVPLGSVAKLQEQNLQNELLRENQRQMIAVTARLSGTTLGETIPRVRQIVERVSLPPGYSYELGGQYESQQHSFRQLLMVLFLAIMLVFILLTLQFRELLPALVILSAAPISLIGAFLMLWITGTEFNVSSFMGLIMLIGLIVKNGIILVEYTFRVQEQENIPLQEALARAGKIRLRPILMTTLVTLFALIPLALGFGAGSELQKPLALAVIGGLSLSMLVTLVFVPVFLLKLKRQKL